MAVASLSRAQTLRDLAFELETLADQVEHPSRSVERADRLIAEGERIGAAVRAAFRGSQ